jgi:hypothetical protein
VLSLRVERCAAAALLLALAACSKEPINLSNGFTPPESSLAYSNQKGGGAENICRVYIGDIADKRTDKDTMGLIGLRVVHGADPVAWLRSGLATLKRDRRIVLADSTSNSDLDLDVDILKAYVINITSDKSANVVVRVHYSRNGAAAGDRVIRGIETGWNWADGGDETQSAFDDALDDLLKTLDQDIAAHCAPGAATQAASSASSP